MKHNSLKLIFSAILFASCTLCVLADVIVMKDGTSIKCYNVDEGTNFVTYTVGKSLSSATKRVRKADVFAIKGDGESELRTLNDASIAENSTSTAKGNAVESDATKPLGLVDVVPAANNQELIKKYSTRYGGHKNKQTKNKGTNSVILFYGITANSILSSQEIEIFFEPIFPDWTSSKDLSLIRYKIQILNNSQHPIYVDLANTLRSHNGSLDYYFFDGTSVSDHSGSNSGISLNAGAVTNVLGIGGVVGTLASGIGLGTGSDKGAGTTYTQQRIISIPPHTKVNLPVHRSVSGKEIHEKFESFGTDDLKTLSKKKDGISKWDSKFYEESQSLDSYQYFITYSTDPDFSTYKQLNFTLFTKECLGIPLASLELKDVKNGDDYIIAGYSTIED